MRPPEKLETKGAGMLLAELGQPFPERFRGGINDQVLALASGRDDQAQVGSFVRAIQANDQVVG